MKLGYDFATSATLAKSTDCGGSIRGTISAAAIVVAPAIARMTMRRNRECVFMAFRRRHNRKTSRHRSSVAQFRQQDDQLPLALCSHLDEDGLQALAGMPLADAQPHRGLRQ